MGNCHLTDQRLDRRTSLKFLALKFLGLTALSSSLGACVGGLPSFESSSGPAPGSASPTGPQGGVPVALILPLTAGGQSGTVGNALKNAAEMALAEFQNPNIRLIIKDDKGSADGARAAAQEALAEGAELIIGPLFATSVQAVASVAKPAGRPVIAFSTDAAVASPGVYLMSFMAELEVQRVVNFAAQQGRRSFAALIPDTAYGRVVEAAFQQTAAQRGVRVAAIERFAIDQGQMEAAVGRLTPALGQIDALFVPENADTLPAIGQALQGAGLNSQRVKLLGTGVWNDARSFRVPQLQGGWFAAPDSGGFNAFAQRYQARFGASPIRLASLAYTAMTLVAALTRQHGAQRFSEAVLTNPSGFDGVDGLFRFRQDGMIERGLAVLEIRNGTSVTVNAAPREFGRSA